MSKPVREVEISTLDEKTGKVTAVFDCGSFHTIIQEGKLPQGTVSEKAKKPLEFRTAAQGGHLHAIGAVFLTITIGKKIIQDSALVSPDLASDMLIGAGTMQKWDISIVNKNGHTEVVVGHDIRDPEIVEID